MNDPGVQHAHHSSGASNTKNKCASLALWVWGKAGHLFVSQSFTAFQKTNPLLRLLAFWAASSSKPSQQPLAQMRPKRRTIIFDMCEVFCGVMFPVEGRELPHQLPQKQAPWSRLPCRPREVQHRCTLVLQGRGSPVGCHWVRISLLLDANSVLVG